MHRPPLRVHARDLNKQANILKAFAAAVSIDMRGAIKSLVNRFKRSYGTSKYTPHQGAREKLRRRVGGFARLHDHNRYPNLATERLERNCPICDMGITHADMEKEV